MLPHFPGGTGEIYPDPIYASLFEIEVQFEPITEKLKFISDIRANAQAYIAENITGYKIGLQQLSLTMNLNEFPSINDIINELKHLKKIQIKIHDKHGKVFESFISSVSLFDVEFEQSINKPNEICDLKACFKHNTDKAFKLF